MSSQTPFRTSSWTTTSEGLPSHFSDQTEINMVKNNDIKEVIPFRELTHLQKLEKIHVKKCSFLEVVFEALVSGIYGIVIGGQY